jgi:uncharacterized protein (TIGR02722 family)
MKKILIVLCVLFLLSACETTGVKRVESGTQKDLSGYWNAVDVKIVCENLINDCLSNQGVNQAIAAKGNKKPVVIVGKFKNASDEQIDTEIISYTMESVIFNSGKLDFVASGDTRIELRNERQDQLGNASEETSASIGKETGADFMLTGSVRTITDRDGNRSIRTYYVTAELTNIETNARLWLGRDDSVTKAVTRPKNRF